MAGLWRTRDKWNEDPYPSSHISSSFITKLSVALWQQLVSQLDSYSCLPPRILFSYLTWVNRPPAFPSHAAANSPFLPLIYFTIHSILMFAQYQLKETEQGECVAPRHVTLRPAAP